MEEKTYHHGNLPTLLIEEGLAIIHEEGLGNFSLRKLAKRVGVSPAACYNHYAGIDQLLEAMKKYVYDKFMNVLQQSITSENPSENTLSMGIAYVKFFAENPNYFAFLYDNEEDLVELTENSIEGEYPPFCMLYQQGILMFKQLGIPEEKYKDHLIAMWSMVHGLAAMANMKGFHYDGDWGELTRHVLCVMNDNEEREI